MNYNNETSKKIMEVALKLFSEKGYYSTTTKEIAKEASVNELTIFRHFGSKSHLFQVTTEAHVMDSQVDEILSDTQHLDFEASMMLIAIRIYELFIKNKKLYKVQMKLADDEKDFIKLKLSRKLISVLEDYFTDLQGQEKIKGNPQLMAVTLVNSLLGAFTVEILSDNTITTIPWQELAKEHARQFISLYRVD